MWSIDLKLKEGRKKGIVLEFEAVVECGKWIDFKLKEWIKKVIFI